jgi:hypothetical protein
MVEYENKHTVKAINAMQQRRIIRAIVRRFEFAEWYKAYQCFESLLNFDHFLAPLVRADLACGLSMLVHNNNPDSVLYGQHVEVWNAYDI